MRLSASLAAIVGASMPRGLGLLAAMLSLLGTVPPPVSLPAVRAVLVCSTLFVTACIVARVLTAGAMTGQRSLLRISLLALASAAALASTTIPHAQFAFLLTMAAAAAGQETPPFSTGLDRAVQPLMYSAFTGILALAMETLLAQSGFASSLHLSLGSRDTSMTYLGIPSACAAALASMWQLREHRLYASVCLLTQVCVGLSYALLVDVRWAWLAPYTVAAVGALMVRDTAPSQRPRISWRGVAALMLLGLSLPWTHAAATPELRGAESRGRIVFYSRGGLDWRTPSYEHTGPWDGGMFGLLPAYLAADGFHTSFADDQAALAQALSEADVVVLINCDEEWSPEHRASIRRFMESDGRLLVLGDHTDVFGLMTGLNTLLADYGVLYRFDSAYHAVDSWQRCAFPVPGSMYDATTFPLVHGIGASLETRWPARPLVSGRHAFSDVGDRQNVMGSFLGNYALDEAEHFGGVALIASACEGRMLVYGDTTAFQNSALSESWLRHVRPVFERLSSKRSLDGGRVLLVAYGIALVLVLALGPRVVTGLLVGASAGSFLVSSLHVGPYVRATSAHALIDLRDAALHGHYEARVNDYGPLLSHLRRSGLLPVVVQEDADTSDAAPALWIVFAPLATPSAERVRERLSFVSQGGALLLVGGGDSAAGAYVAPLGFSPGVALGEFPPRRGVDDDPLLPRFRRAWSIRNERGNAVDVLCSARGYDAAIGMSSGVGRLAWVADSLYFSHVNIEGLWGSHPGNMQWTRSLLEYLLRRPAVAVEEPWKSPSTQH